MVTTELSFTMLRAIYKQPTQRDDRHRPPLSLPPCVQDDAPLIVIVVPGIAQSGDAKVLDPLKKAIEKTITPMVTTGPTPWSLDNDILAYAERLRSYIQSEVKTHPGRRLALVAFSLGGTAALYYLSKFRGDSFSAANRPLIITLASPTYGSERFRRAFFQWRRSSPDQPMGALETLVEQLDPSSSIMTTVRAALLQHDVHMLLSADDQIVDHHTACPAEFTRVKEFDMCSSSPLKRHFGFPQDPAVIQEVTTLLQRHVAMCREHAPVPVGATDRL